MLLVQFSPCCLPRDARVAAWGVLCVGGAGAASSRTALVAPWSCCDAGRDWLGRVVVWGGGRKTSLCLCSAGQGLEGTGWELTLGQCGTGASSPPRTVLLR